VYDVPAVAPITQEVSEALDVVQLPPPGDAVTVYPVAPAVADQDAVSEDPPALRLTPVGAGVPLLEAALTTIVIAGVTSVPAEFVAVTRKVLDPAVVGAPERTPVVGFRLRPAGSEPELTEYVGAGLPEAANG
jgi:hypothetical protein